MLRNSLPQRDCLLHHFFIPVFSGTQNILKKKDENCCITKTDEKTKIIGGPAKDSRSKFEPRGREEVLKGYTAHLEIVRQNQEGCVNVCRHLRSRAGGQKKGNRRGRRGRGRGSVRGREKGRGGRGRENERKRGRGRGRGRNKRETERVSERD